ncbi:hypothetical protein F5879DRAFT_923166 [Lentinula edodes]|nr:hypothetical protein F5879DRAFT_923166 [Lentinula edodes]
MASLLRLQPLKGLYLIYQLISTVLIRLPIWVLTSIPRSWRPRPHWTMRKSVKLKVVRHMIDLTTIIGPLRKTPNHLAITPGTGVNGVWIPPIPGLVKEELERWANVSQVISTEIPGYWQHKKGSTIDIAAPPMPGEKVIYSLHGGGYITFSAHPSDMTAAIARGLLQHVDSVHRVFSCEYRLSSGEGVRAQNPFPAALIDALAGYVYLVDIVKFDPADIILEAPKLRPSFSTWRSALALSLGRPQTPNAWLDNAKSDFIDLADGGTLARAVISFVGPHGLKAAETNPMISPGSRNPEMKIHFHGFPRTFIAAGGAEVLYDMLCSLRERMVSDLGEGDGVRPGDGKVCWYCPPDASHDWVAFPQDETERIDTLKVIAIWVTAS